MADKLVSALTDIDALADADSFPVLDASATSELKEVTASQIATYMASELGATFQPLDSDLTTIAAGNNGAVLAATTASFTTADETKLDALDADLATFAVPASTTISAFGATLVDDANAAAAIATLGLDADIATLALPASTTISAFGATLVDDANAAAAIATLGLDADLATFAVPASTTISAFGATLIDDAAAVNARATLDVPSTTEAILDTIIDAKGDLITATAADTPARLAIGATNGHVLTVDSAEATGLKWAAAAGGSSLTEQEKGLLAGLQGAPAFRATRYYPARHGAVSGAIAWGANQLSYVPIYVPKTQTMDRIAVYSYGATANARLGIYNSHATTGLPDSLLLDAGVVTQIAAGDKIITISQSLTGGFVYWLCCVLDATGNIMQCATTANTASPFDGGFNLLSDGPGGNTRLWSTHTYGALPSTAPSFNYAAAIPMVAVRAS